MGLDVNGVKLLLHAHCSGIDFSSFAMIGRQSLHLSCREFQAVLSQFGFKVEQALVKGWLEKKGAYAEDFLNMLGAKTIHSFDYSNYENASCIHDMNLVIANEYKGRYSVVIDSGSLEHVFNFPVAIRNCMEMVREGGYFLCMTPANNFMGHGFYQFSPELFFSVFSAENGFEVDKVVVVESRRGARWYQAKNPREVRRRITLTNSMPTYMLVIAKKLATVEIFKNPPMQSDYVTEWSGAAGARSKWSGSAFARYVYKPAERRLKKFVRLFFSGLNPRFYKPIDPRRSRD